MLLWCGHTWLLIINCNWLLIITIQPSSIRIIFLSTWPLVGHRTLRIIIMTILISGICISEIQAKLLIWHYLREYLIICDEKIEWKTRAVQNWLYMFNFFTSGCLSQCKCQNTSVCSVWSGQTCEFWLLEERKTTEETECWKWWEERTFRKRNGDDFHRPENKSHGKYSDLYL